jgi:spore coat polysaccharide biosynthesis predicted glycosyltransferase SpsG
MDDQIKLLKTQKFGVLITDHFCLTRFLGQISDKIKKKVKKIVINCNDLKIDDLKNLFPGN